MSSASEVKSSRYSLRPRVGAFDLCINRNKYGLIRTIVGRQSGAIKVESLTPDSSPNSSPCSSPDRGRSRSRSSSPSLNNNKRKFRLELIEKIDAKKICSVSSTTTTTPIVIVPKVWQLPVRTSAVRRPPPRTLYDVSKMAYFMNLDEICLFEIFNHLSLNDICAMGDVCKQLQFAAQKYFDVMYTAVNLAWLSDDDSGQFTLVQAERLLRNFGHLISTITVNTKQLKPTDCKEKLLILIEKYCDGILFWNTY